MFVRAASAPAIDVISDFTGRGILGGVHELTEKDACFAIGEEDHLTPNELMGPCGRVESILKRLVCTAPESTTQDTHVSKIRECNIASTRKFKTRNIAEMCSSNSAAILK